LEEADLVDLAAKVAADLVVKEVADLEAVNVAVAKVAAVNVAVALEREEAANNSF